MNGKKMTDNAVATQSAAGQGIAEITQGADFYTSLELSTRDDKLNFLRKINNSEPLVEQVGNEIKVVDVVIQGVRIPNEATGMVEDTLRTTLIDEDGNAFHATSKGIAQILRQTFNTLGTPDLWIDSKGNRQPLEVKPVEKRGRNGYRFLTLEV
jgi:hypothetical protein